MTRRTQRTPKLRRLTIPAAIATAALVIGGCSTGSTEETTSEQETQGDASAFPVTIEHAFGETEISEAPTKVVTVGWNDHDSVAALGVVPTASPKITWGGNDASSTDFFDEAITKLGADPADVTRYDDSDGVPVDEIAAMQPDLILGVNSGMKEAEYKKLSKIAPTVAYPKVAWGTPWDTQTMTIGKALGLEDEAEELVEETRQLIKESAAKYPDLKGKSAAWMWFNPADLSSVGIYTATDLRPQMLSQFGLTEPKVVSEGSKKNPGEFYFNVSAEKANTIDSDIVIFYANDEKQSKLIADHKLLGQIPAIKKGQYVGNINNADVMPMSSPSPLSIPFALKKFLPKLSSAAQGTPAQ